MKNKMVVFNCTVNVVGGAVQNAVNFIKIIEERTVPVEFNLYYLLSQAVYEQASSFLREGSYSVFASPAKSLSARKMIKDKVTELCADLVYTSAGPAYIEFPCHHIMGCSNPYLLAPPNEVVFFGSWISNIKERIRLSYQRRFLESANEYIFQTEISRDDFFKHVNYKPNAVVHNSISVDFGEISASVIDRELKKIIVPSAYYKHKNLEFVIESFKLLLDRGYSFSLFFTINSCDYERYLLPLVKKFGIEEYVTNLGPYMHENALELYLEYDIVLQPSALEVFSTTYIEAISLIKPLVVCDLGFSKGICKEYPEYFTLNDIESLSKALLNSKKHYTAFDEKSKLSKIILKQYGSQIDRVKQLVSILVKSLKV